MVSLAEFAPEGTFIAPRLMEELQPGTPFAGLEAEALSGALLAVSGNLPILAHSAASTAPLLDAIATSGLQPPTAIGQYNSREDYVAHVRARMAAGGRAWFTHAVPLGLFSEEPTLVSPSIMQDLNLRTAIERLVPSENQPNRRVFEGAADVARALAQLRPGLVVKDAQLPSSSGGAGVWVLRQQRHVRRASVGLEGSSRIVIEDRIAYTANHCVQCIVTGENEVAFLGSSAQITSASGIYLGNRLEPAAPVSPQTSELAVTIARAAARMGYRGIAGFDILERADGPPVAIDLNFRPNGSTPFLLAFQSLGPTRGFAAANLVYGSAAPGAAALLARLRPMIHDGWLAVLGLFDPREAGHPNASITVRLLVMGPDMGDVHRRRKALRAAGLLLADERPSLVQRVAWRLRRLTA